MIQIIAIMMLLLRIIRMLMSLNLVESVLVWSKKRSPVSTSRYPRQKKKTHIMINIQKYMKEPSPLPQPSFTAHLLAKLRCRCVCVYIYVYIYIYICIERDVHMCICICIYVYIYYVCRERERDRDRDIGI